MALIDRLEKRFGWIAAPHLLTAIALLQFLVFILYVMRGEHGADFLEFLQLDRVKVMHGEVWRLFSYIFVPRSQSMLWIVFAVLMLHMMGAYLEAAMGAFKLTLFVFGTVLGISLGVMIAPSISHSQMLWENSGGVDSAGAGAPLILWTLLGTLFGVKCPEFQFRLYFLIPVSARILGWLGFAFLVFIFIATPSLRVPILLGMVPFLCVLIPALYDYYLLKNRVWKMRPDFKEATAEHADGFCKCHVCGRTDKSDPELTFRIAADDNEYCQEHLPQL